MNSNFAYQCRGCKIYTNTRFSCSNCKSSHFRMNINIATMPTILEIPEMKKLHIKDNTIEKVEETETKRLIIRIEST